MVGPVAPVRVLPDELDGKGSLDVVGHVEQLAPDDPDIVLLEAGLRLGCSWGRGRPLYLHRLLLGRGGLLSVTLSTMDKNVRMLKISNLCTLNYKKCIETH